MAEDVCPEFANGLADSSFDRTDGFSGDELEEGGFAKVLGLGSQFVPEA